ncbi:MAG: cyclodeaminase/cyclohydrolase family protein [Bryobacteraceae bacterium]
MTEDGLGAFINALAAPTATPGGGSASAAAGAMAAGLGGMVAGIAKLDGYDFDTPRRFLTAAVERDSTAYDKVMAAYKRPKAERKPFVEEAMREATLVPLEVAEHAVALRATLARLAQEAPPRVASDVITARALVEACLTGALANVRINIAYLAEDEFRAMVESRAVPLT